MKLNILQLICLINYVVTFHDELFDELWQTNQSEAQANNNPIESQPKIKVESNEEQFDRDKSAIKGIVKVEHEPHYGAVKVEEKDKIKHEFKWRDEESAEFKEQLEDHVKEEDQDGQAPNTSEQKKIGDNSKKHLSDQNNSTDQDQSVDEQQNESKKCKTIEYDQQKREIIQKFREMKDNYRKKNKRAHSAKEWNQIEIKISNRLGVGRTILYKWIKELGLNPKKISEFEKREILKQFHEIKSKCTKANLKNISKNELDDKIAKKLDVSARTIYQWKREFGLSVSNKKFSEFQKREILKQFDEIKSKCKKAKLKSISKNELDDKIAKKLGVSASTIRKWKRVFGLSASNKISDSTKIGILKKYAKIKRKNPNMSDCGLADLLKISSSNLCKWKAKFNDENKHL